MERVCLDEKIHVAFCIDKNCPIQVLLVINSILINNKSNSKYKFYIVENNLSFFDKLHIKFFVKNHKQEVEILHINMRDITKGKNLYSKSASQHITNMGLARILLPKLLPNLDKVLYLDYDILVLEDLKALWDTYLGKNLLAMTIDPFTNIKLLPKEVTCFSNKFFHEAMKWKEHAGKKYWAKFPDFYFNRKEYYNDGIFLMNIPECIKESIEEKAFEFIKNNNLPIPDQDALNEVAKNKITIFDVSWNCFFDLYLKNDLYLKWNSDLAKIIHYTTPKKPWKYLFDKHKYFKLYNDYWNKSYLRIFKIKYIMVSFNNLVKSFFNENIKRKILDFKYKNI